MSEIKGQLLGVILVLSLFGILSVALTKVFTDATNSMTNTVNEVIGAEDTEQIEA